MSQINIRLRNESLKNLELLTKHFQGEICLDLSKSQIVDMALKNLVKKVIKKEAV